MKHSIYFFMIKKNERLLFIIYCLVYVLFVLYKLDFRIGP